MLGEQVLPRMADHLIGNVLIYSTRDGASDAGSDKSEFVPCLEHLLTEVNDEGAHVKATSPDADAILRGPGYGEHADRVALILP